MIRLIKSFGYAIHGIMTFLRRERNGQLQAFAAVCTVALGFYLHISNMEWILIIACIGAVISLEMINSSIERICNISFEGYHREVKLIKDMAAGAVLIAAIASLIIALIIFVPKIMSS